MVSSDAGFAITVFGPLRLWGPQGRTITPQGRQGLILERLCLTPNRPVSTEELLAAGWADGVPDRGEKALQVVVSRVRAALPDVAGLRLVRRGDAYVLEATVDALDLVRFDQLAQDGLSGTNAGAATTLMSALDLAGQQAFVGFQPCPVLERERARVDDLRSQVRAMLNTKNGDGTNGGANGSRHVELRGLSHQLDVGSVPRLLAGRLSDAPGGTVTVVVAPAGSGKSTLLAQVAAIAPRVAWLTLEPVHDDPVRFQRDLLATLRTAVPGFLGDARIIDADPLSMLYRDRWLDAIDAAGELLIVIDDFHVLTNTETIGWVADVARALPPTVRLSLGSRRPPAIRLSRLRVSRRVIEVGADDLRFDEHEAAQLFESFGVLATDQQLAAEVGRSSGWVAALVLSGISAGSTGRLGEGPASQGAIESFFGEEVLDELPDDIRTFLLDTALLDSFDDQLASRVTGIPDAASIVREVTARGLFIAPTARPGWWRYHQLFRDALLRRRLDMQPERQDELHRRAAAALMERREPELALAHVVAIGDHDLLARLIAGRSSEPAEAADSLAVHAWLRGEHENLQRWISLLPASHIEHNEPALVMAMTAALAAGDVRSLARWIDPLQQVSTIAADDNSPVAKLLVGAATLYTGNVEDSARTLALGSDQAGAPPWVGLPVEFFATGCLSEALLLADRLDEAASKATVAIELARRLGVTRHVAFEHAALGLIALMQGRDSDAEQHHAEALAAADVMTENLDLPYVGSLTALMHQRHGDLPSASKAIEATLAHPRFAPLMLPAALPYIVLAGVDARLGDKASWRTHLDLADLLLRDARGAHLLERLAEDVRSDRLPVDVLAEDSTLRQQLSDRERTVLRLLHGQLTLREIANELYVSVNTVKTHTQSLYRKLGVSTRSEAIQAATRAGGPSVVGRSEGR